MSRLLDDLEIAMRAWTHLADRHLGNEASFHALFATWNLCNCLRCDFDALNSVNEDPERGRP